MASVTARSAADAGSRRACGQEARRPPGHPRCRIPDHGRAVIRTRGLVQVDARSSPETSPAGVVAPIDLQASHRSVSSSFNAVVVTPRVRSAGVHDRSTPPWHGRFVQAHAAGALANLAAGSPSVWRHVVPACCATAMIGPSWLVPVAA
jgi:hypothetical protein